MYNNSRHFVNNNRSKSFGQKTNNSRYSIVLLIMFLFTLLIVPTMFYTVFADQTTMENDLTTKQNPISKETSSNLDNDQIQTAQDIVDSNKSTDSSSAVSNELPSANNNIDEKPTNYTDDSILVQNELPVVSGKVTDTEGNVISGARVVLLASDDSCLASVYSQTDGSYSMTASAQKGVYIECSYNNASTRYYDFVSQQFDLSVDTKIDIALTKAQNSIIISGTTTDRGKNKQIVPYANFTYYIYDESQHNSCEIYSAMSDENGKFELVAPKDKTGHYIISKLGYHDLIWYLDEGLTSKDFTLDADWTSFFKQADPAYVYVNIQALGYMHESNLGEIEYNELSYSDVAYPLTFEVAEGEDGNLIAPSYSIDADGVLKVKSIYEFESTFIPKRYGGCQFANWLVLSEPINNNINEADIDKDTNFDCVFYEIDPEYNVNISGSDNKAFKSYSLEYSDSNKKEIKEDIIEGDVIFEEVLFSGSKVTRLANDVVSISYEEPGEILGHEYSELSTVKINMQDEYEVDSILLNEQELAVGQEVFVEDDANFQVSYKHLDSDNSSSASAQNNNLTSSTSDYNSYTFMFLFILVLVSGSVVFFVKKIHTD